MLEGRAMCTGRDCTSDRLNVNTAQIGESVAFLGEVDIDVVEGYACFQTD